MEKRLILLAVAPVLLAIVAFGAMQAQPRTAEAAISAPSGLNASAPSPGVIRFDWNAGNENIWYCVNYAYSFADLATGGPTWRNAGCWTTNTVLDVGGIACGTTVYWNVYAWNTTTSATSQSAAFQSPGCSSLISPPTDLSTSKPSPGTIRFDWDPGQNNIWYCLNVASSFADLATGGPSWFNAGCWTTSSQITLSNLPCDRTLYWNVFTWNNVTSATSDVATVQTDSCSSVFSPPDDLEASNITRTSVRLTWDAGLGNIWFCVNMAESEADLGSGLNTWKNFGCWSTTESLNVSGLDCETTYYWNVFAWNNVTNGTSATANFTTSPCSNPAPTPTPTTAP
jgi:hypothetical protein